MVTSPGKVSKFALLLSASARSRLGWLLVCLHGLWFFLAVASLGPPSLQLAEFVNGSNTLFAGRLFHFHYASMGMKLLVLFDMPAEFAAIPLEIVVLGVGKVFRVSLFSLSYVSAGLELFAASCQWLLVGYKVGHWVVRKKRGIQPS